MGVECNQLYLLWQDASGELGTNFLTVQNQAPYGGGPYGTLATAMKNLSSAKMRAIQFEQNLNQSDATSASAYPSVRDRVSFPLRTAAGLPGTLHLLAPRDDIFLPGNVLVDMSNSLVAAMVAQVTAVLGDAAGNPWVTVSQGRRMRVGP